MKIAKFRNIFEIFDLICEREPTTTAVHFDEKNFDCLVITKRVHKHH